MFSAHLTQVAQLEAIIRSAQALLQAGLIDEATSLLAAFRPKFNRTLTEVRIGPHQPGLDASLGPENPRQRRRSHGHGHLGLRRNASNRREQS